MELQCTVYSVLLVSSSDKFNAAMTGLLPESRYRPLRIVASISEARRAVLENSYDLILINTPLRDEFGTRFAGELCRGSTSGVMVFVRAEHYEDACDKLGPLGGLVICKPTGGQIVSQSLSLLCATRERLRRLEARAESLEEKMEEIRLINRAKLLLIEQLKMTEADAHRYLEKTAMDRCVTKREIAEIVIKTYQ